MGRAGRFRINRFSPPGEISYRAPFSSTITGRPVSFALSNALKRMAMMAVEIARVPSVSRVSFFFFTTKFSEFRDDLYYANFGALLHFIENFATSIPITLFNSLEYVYFRLKTNNLVFRVITKITESGEFKIQFQFAKSDCTDPVNAI